MPQLTAGRWTWPTSVWEGEIARRIPGCETTLPMPVLAPGRRATRDGGGASSGGSTDSSGVSDAGSTSVIRPDATRIP